MEKPSCLVCGAELEQPATGRPPSYCSPVHRRAAEYELRRVQSLLTQAEKASQRARAAQATNTWDKSSARASVKFWTAEVNRLQLRLLALLSADSPQQSPES
jgi:hypothetical protein